MDRETKIEEAFLAPVGSALVSYDTQIVERDGWYQVITPSSGTTQGNEVVLSRIADADVGAVIDRTIYDYARHQVPFKWCVGPLTTPADMGHALERRGFVGWPVRGMALDALTWSRSAHEDIAIEPVSEANLPAYYACWVRGWETTVADIAAWIDDHLRAIATGRFHFYLARIDGEAVGTAGIIMKPHCAYLVGGNVLPPFRGRGVYRALVDERIELARRQAMSLVVTQAREATSAPILAHLGFESLYTSHVYKWEP